MKNPVPEPCRIIEIDDAGWEAFKQLEAKERREYSLSGEARKDHEEWVNAPMAEDDQWGSSKDGAWVEPRTIATRMGTALRLDPRKPEER